MSEPIANRRLWQQAWTLIRAQRRDTSIQKLIGKAHG
jgi:hypothetical protein